MCTFTTFKKDHVTEKSHSIDEYKINTVNHFGGKTHIYIKRNAIIQEHTYWEKIQVKGIDTYNRILKNVKYGNEKNKKINRNI